MRACKDFQAEKMNSTRTCYSNNPHMEYTTAPLTDNYKFKVKSLFLENWPEKPESDFEISWDGRDISSLVILDMAAARRGKFLGFVIASYHKRSDDNLYIDYIALTNECRGRGIGSKILATYVSQVFATRSSLHLWPDKDELLVWYTKHGFTHTNDRYYNFHSYETRRQAKIHKRLGLS